MTFSEYYPYQGYVIKIALQFSNIGIDFDDRKQIGAEAAIKAITKYSEESPRLKRKMVSMSIKNAFLQIIRDSKTQKKTKYKDINEPHEIKGMRSYIPIRRIEANIMLPKLLKRDKEVDVCNLLIGGWEGCEIEKKLNLKKEEVHWIMKLIARRSKLLEEIGVSWIK